MQMKNKRKTDKDNVSSIHMEMLSVEKMELYVDRSQA